MKYEQKFLSLIILSLLAVFLGGSIQKAFSQFSNPDCLTCHSDNTLIKKLPDGTTKSLFVDQNVLEKSRHKELGCVDCHQGIEELPHPETLKSPMCTDCHSDLASVVAKGLHSKIKGTCFKCHGSHNVLSPKDPNSPTYKANQEQTCLSCHKDREDKSFTKYHHSEVVFPGGAKGKVACNQCHDAHLPTLPDPQKVCIKCHPDILADQKKRGACHNLLQQLS